MRRRTSAPSDNESFGLVQLEEWPARFRGGSDVGGLPEVSHKEWTAISFLRHLDEMAERVLDILGDEARRHEMGKRAREKARPVSALDHHPAVREVLRTDSGLVSARQSTWPCATLSNQKPSELMAREA